MLSLDPQRTHFALSEEESMQRFIDTMSGSDFAPVGSSIQFFTSFGLASQASASTHPGVIFGVHGPSEPAAEQQTEKFHEGLFGALSNKGVFLTGGDGATTKVGSLPQESKLSVPHSRVFLTHEGETWPEAVGEEILYTFAGAFTRH